MNKDILNLIDFRFVISSSLKKSFIIHHLQGKFGEIVLWICDMALNPK